MNVPILMTTIESINAARKHYPGKKELQKIVYLLQKKGVSFDYPYRFYFYGPYSDMLDEDIRRLTLRGELEIEYADTHTIKTSQVHDQELADQETSRLIQSILSELDGISARNLELMATILYLIDNNYVEDLSDEAILSGVNSVKPDKYKEETILFHYNLLKEKQFVCVSAP